MAKTIDYSSARKEMARLYRMSIIKQKKAAQEALNHLVGLLNNYSELVEMYIADPFVAKDSAALSESPLFKKSMETSLSYNLFKESVAKAKDETGCSKQHVIEWAVCAIKQNEDLSGSVKELLEEGDNWIIRRVTEAGLSISELPPIVLRLSKYDMDRACGLKASK